MKINLHHGFHAFFILCLLASPLLIAGCEDRNAVEPTASIQDADGGLQENSDPEILASTGLSANIEHLYFYDLNAVGSSCATFSPKEKAETNAVSNAVSRAEDRYISRIAADIRDGGYWATDSSTHTVFTNVDSRSDEDLVESLGETLCGLRGLFYDGLRGNAFDIDRISEWRGEDCGWKVRVEVDASVCFVCR